MAKARGAAGVAAPKPFEQGDLDGLCGVYAVVNAVRLVALPHHRLPAAECRALFAALVPPTGAGLAVKLRLVAELWAGGDPIGPGDGGPLPDGHDRVSLLWRLVDEAEAQDAAVPPEVDRG